MTEADAVYAFFAAFAVAALLTPLTARLARRVGAIDQPKERGLGAGSTPLLGGLAVLGGVLVSSAIFLDFGGATSDRLKGILAGAGLPHPQLPPGVGLHGRLRVEPPRAAAGLHRRRGRRQDAGRARPALPAR